MNTLPAFLGPLESLANTKEPITLACRPPRFITSASLPLQVPALAQLGPWELAGGLQNSLGMSVTLRFLGILAGNNQGNYRLFPHFPCYWELLSARERYIQKAFHPGIPWWEAGEGFQHGYLAYLSKEEEEEKRRKERKKTNGKRCIALSKKRRKCYF